MILHISKSQDPYFNLALEENFLREYEDEVFMLWQNDNTIVIGKNQNTLAEINLDYVKENDIRVVRRITGGGAVYHDMGNLNFTYITRHCGEWENDFSRFAAPVISALGKLSVHAELSGRNDIVVDGRKISGNAQTVVGDRILHHGTILFNTDVSVLSNALTPDPEKIKSKGVRSVVSRVANLSEFLGERANAENLISAIRTEVEKMYGAREYLLSEDEIKRAEELADKKYRTWEWNFGYSPKYTFSKKKRFDGGSISAYLSVVDGKIESAKLFGDFFFVSELSDIEKALSGVRHEKRELEKALLGFKISDYFGAIPLEGVLETLV